jgi:hypothetical protein
MLYVLSLETLKKLAVASVSMRSDAVEPGDKCICSEHELYNAFGDKQTMLTRGQRLHVRESRLIGALRFYSFRETPADQWFAWDAFTPMRNLN